MANNNAIRVQFETLRSLAFGSIGANYAAVGTPFVHPIRFLKLYNTTDVDLFVSFDGTNNHEIIQTATWVLYEYCSNKSNMGGIFEQAAGTQVWTKEVTAGPGSGALYVTVVYAGG